MDPKPQGHLTASGRLESTSELLGRVRQGDERALNHLIETFRPLLWRWAHGRLPSGARALSDTEDLVQVTLVRVLDRIEEFDSRHPGAFLGYLRRAFLNNMRNEIRLSTRRPAGDQPHDEMPDASPSPLEQAIGSRALEAYEEALERLSEEEKAAVIMRVELDCKHREIAEFIGSPTPNAARMLVSRALNKLAALIDEEALRDAAE